MTLVSYAQNFEDVMLWRALRHVGPGLYVDVGAQHPLIDSVSKAFYEQGWRGVHIEPVARFAELLRADRPDETVLQVALSDTEGTLTLNVIPETGLSTAVDRYAERHRSERGYAHQRVEVPVLTLASALRSLAGKQVHWLKIDVEGFEAHVLRGWDSQALRPWIIVVEATIPNSTEPDYAAWDPILVAAAYRMVYFDGLNRFYIAAEHEELAAAFAAPPNVFDDFELSGQGSWKLYRRVQDGADAVRWLAAEQLSAARHEAALARRHIAALSAQADALQNALDLARGQAEEQAAQAHRWWQMADGLKRELAEIRSSRGWRWFSIVSNALRRPAHPAAAVPAAENGAHAAALHAAPVKLSPGAARHYRQLTRALQKRES
jgi:FkbM family methyltransferase